MLKNDTFVLVSNIFIYILLTKIVQMKFFL
jgi:hypothetical protein